MIDPLLVGYLLTVFGGLLFCALAVDSHRRERVPGTRAFSVFLVVLGIGAIASIGLDLVFGGIAVEDAAVTELPLWALTGIVPLVFSAVAWFIFALKYTGQSTRLTRRRLAIMTVPMFGVIPLLIDAAGSGPTGRAIVQLPATVAGLYALALFFVGGYLLLRTTYRYGHLSVAQGICLSVPPFLLFMAINSPGMIVLDWGQVGATAMYASSYLLSAGLIGIAIYRYDTFEATPAVGAIGERAIAREIDDLVFVLDHRERVITLNDAAADTLDIADDGSLGKPFDSVMGYALEDLETLETVEIRLDYGHRKFDPQVSSLRDQHDRRLGTIVSLRDVTDRELRQERLTVLNRVLRHNHRNQIDVIRANAEELLTEEKKEHARSIIGAADALSELSQDAREIDRFLSQPLDRTRTDLHDAIEEVVTEYEDEHIAIHVDQFNDIEVIADPAAVSFVLEHAIGYAVDNGEETVQIGVIGHSAEAQIDIAYDGDPIPVGEREALAAGTERPLRHGQGLSLWLVKWGVTKLNGTVSYQREEGAGMRIELPTEPMA